MTAGGRGWRHVGTEARTTRGRAATGRGRPTIGDVRAPDELRWQPSLLAIGVPEIDRRFLTLARRHLSEDAWVDHAPGWLGGADDVFAQLLEHVDWAQQRRWMYEQQVVEPRLTVRYDLAADEVPHPVLRDAADALGQRYDVEFVALGCNLYRDGRDSVAWHGDRVARDLPSATIAIISLGAVRPLRLRPKGGGPSISYSLGPGDLFVMGGSCQRTWDHAVPKTRRAGPRISVQLRHAY